MESSTQLEHLTVPQEKKEDRFSKYLFSLIVIFLIIVFVMLGYLLYLKFFRDQDDNQEIVLQTTKTIQKVSESSQQYTKNIDVDIAGRFTEDIKIFSQRSELVDEIKLSYTLRGRVEEISTETSEPKLTKISIISENGVKIGLIFLESDMENTSVFFVTKDKTVTSNFSKIVVGDLITMEYKADFLNRNNPESYVIKIIRK